MIYLDIETIPQDPEPWAPAPKPPSGWKDPEKIAAWQAEHADDTRDETSLQALWGGIVVCVGIARDGHPVTVLRAPTLDEAGERVLLSQLARGLDAYPRDPIVTWNGASFDLPFLARRALRHGVWSLARRVHRSKPWDDHDLYQAWCCGERMARGRLVDVARYLGIEGLDSVSGADVAGLILQPGGLDMIALHCASDVAVLREVHRHMVRAGWAVGPSGPEPEVRPCRPPDRRTLEAEVAGPRRERLGAEPSMAQLLELRELLIAERAQ